jgi:hypothetical protein
LNNNCESFCTKNEIPTFVPVKKLIATFTLIGFLISTTEVHEIFKIQHLVAHYLEHTAKEGNTPFAEFLHIHYSHDHNNHHDDHHDKGCLPFQGDHGYPVNFIGVSLQHPIEFAIGPQALSPVLQQKLPNFTFSDYLSKIWQPPRLA